MFEREVMRILRREPRKKVNGNKVNVECRVNKVNDKVDDTSTRFMATTKMTAVDHYHKRGAAASGHGISFVTSVAMAMK